MDEYRRLRGADGAMRVEVPLSGADLLRHPMYTKGTAFTPEERRTFKMDGLLPTAVSTLDRQCRRVYAHIQRKDDALEKYIGLAALLDRNETLFYRVLVDHVEEFLPIVYTPTVGLACQRFSHIFRRGRGLWITPDHVGRIDEVLGCAPWRDVRLVVVTDNERILGLGDQGAGGMAIPIGKLSLYTAAAGLHPTRCLPVSLDVGTDNEPLRDDPLYLGWRHPRLRGAPYYALVDEFVRAVDKRFPRALLQWEDFKKDTAFQLMERYREVLPSFNDDIQGTAAVALAGVLAGCRATDTPLKAQRIVILGAGGAGIGIARLLRSALARAGATPLQLHEAIAAVDVDGLLVAGDPNIDPRAADLAWPAGLAAARGLGAGWRRDLEAVVRAVRPTVLIGTTGAPGAFTEKAVRTMAEGCPRPLVFPLSNPTSHSEARPIDVLRWTEGRALVATGSPFSPVALDNRTIQVAQANNVHVFPALGLGALVADARVITDNMILVAAERLADLVDEHDLAGGALFPPMRELRTNTAEVAFAVARAARDEGVGRRMSDADIATAIREEMWEPVYATLVPAEPGPLSSRRT